MQHAPAAETYRITLPRPRFVPWTVPTWLPRAAEGPATLLVGVLAGVLLAFSCATLIDVLTAICSMPTPPAAHASRSAAVLEPGTRALVIAGPLTAPERAPIAVVEPVAASPAPRHVAARSGTARKTATARAVPRRDVLFAAALAP